MNVPSKILIISLAGIGDTLLAVPVIQRLKEKYPKALIDVLVRWPAACQILEENKNINAVYLLSQPAPEPPFCSPFPKWFLKNRKSITETIFQLRKQRYDLSINVYPQSKVHYRIIAKLINGKVRLSHQYPNCAWFDRWLLTTTKLPIAGAHCVENNMDLIGSEYDKRKLLDSIVLNDYKTPTDEFDNLFMDRKTIGIHVGSGTTKNLQLKRWPVKNWKRLINQLSQYNVLLFGGPDESEIHREIQSTCPNAVVMPQLHLKKTAHLISKCDLFVSVDTALMHLASLVNVPNQIVIQSPTFNPSVEPIRKYTLVPNPWLDQMAKSFYAFDGNGIRMNQKENQECMESVTVDMVIKTITSLI